MSRPGCSTLAWASCLVAQIGLFIFFLKKTKLKISVGTVVVDRFQSTILLDNFNQADRRVPCVNEQRRRLLVELIYKWSKESY